jgi:hypothetical protein
VAAEDLSAAIQARRAYNDILETELSLVAQHLSDGGRVGDLPPVVTELEERRRQAFEAMNAAFARADVGPFPWIPIEELIESITP